MITVKGIRHSSELTAALTLIIFTVCVHVPVVVTPRPLHRRGGLLYPVAVSYGVLLRYRLNFYMRGHTWCHDKSIIIPIICLRGQTYTSRVPPHVAVTRVANTCVAKIINNTFDAKLFPQ